MAQAAFIKIFDNNGIDYNFGATASPFGVQYTGEIFFPKVSVGLIESRQLFLLQEVTADFQKPYLRAISGSVAISQGSTAVSGSGTLFTKFLVAGDSVQIDSSTYVVSSIASDELLYLTTASVNSDTKGSIYLLDYLGYNQLIQSSDVLSEQLVAEFPVLTGVTGAFASGSTSNFFVYDVEYNQTSPLIQTSQSSSYPIAPGSTNIDVTTGRVIVDRNQNSVVPLSVNVGFTGTAEGIYRQNLNLYLQKDKIFAINSVPSPNGDGTWTVTLAYTGYLDEFDAMKTLSLQRGYTSSSQDFPLQLISATQDSTYTYLKVKEVSSYHMGAINVGNLSSFSIYLQWTEPLVSLQLYAEAEAEDERLRLTLENFGRGVDQENEYIFRDSDIKEGLTDYVLLNKKRKELLLQGDTIYPYLGSYAGLINVLNFFGYNDIQIKEYFLVVDSASPDNGKYLAAPIPGTPGENNDWLANIRRLLPSIIYQKTSLLGLYYNLNTDTGKVDENGIPIYVNESQFTPEEVLIKLYGLKNLLTKSYLPINVRIKDITGDGIYFQGIEFETWQDSVQISVIEIGSPPTVNLFPQGGSYIRDLRRIDQYYVEKYKALGYSGFLGSTAPSSSLTVYENLVPEMQLGTASIGINDSAVENAPANFSIAYQDYYDPDLEGPGDLYIAGTYSVSLQAQSKKLNLYPTLADAQGTADYVNYYHLPADVDIIAQIVIEENPGPPDIQPIKVTIFGYSNNSGDNFDASTFFFNVSEVIPQAVETSNGDSAVIETIVDNISPSLASLANVSVGSFNGYDAFTTWDNYDSTWITMPPGIYDANFNVKAAYYKPLPDDPNGTYPTGAPVLIETIFALLWNNCSFSWDQVSTHQVFPGTYVVNPISTGSTYSVTITDYFGKSINSRGFSNGDPITISSSPFDGIGGVYYISSVSGSSFQIVIETLPTHLTGDLNYSQPISAIPSDINRHSWDTIARGEYLDMRVLATMYGDNTFVYDSGRKPIDQFAVPYYDPNIKSTYNRLLDTVVFPYEGTYDVSVYIYDITNNFTMTVLAYQALTPTAEITASYQSQNDFGTWDDIHLDWFHASFDWYYPDYALSEWQEADLQWDSLQSYSYEEQGLLEDVTLQGILEINRDKEYVVVKGSYIGNQYAQNGDYLYFDYETSAVAVDTYRLAPTDITVISSTQFKIIVTNVSVPLWARVLIKRYDVPFDEINTSDFFYADVIQISGNTLTLQGPADMINYFGTFWDSDDVYMDAGVYNGSYAVEILSVGETGSNTIFYLTDTHKYLYKLDGYFKAYLTAYDVDYAAAHIGKHGDDYQNITDVSWNDFNGNSWWAEERQPSASTGFLITTVSMGGKIQLGGYDPFFFSGNGKLAQDELSSLFYAAEELNSSTNPGICKYEYSVFPSYRLSITGATGTNLYITSSVSTGATSISLSGTPVGITGGSLIWTGDEWHTVSSVSGSTVNLREAVIFPIAATYRPLLPYTYHTQIFGDNPKELNQYYFFIMAIAKGVGLNTLDEVTFGNGVEGEWAAHPQTSYSLPLNNSLLYQLQGQYMNDNAPYQYWKSNGENFPVIGYNEDDSRALYAGVFHEAFSYSDAVITPKSFQIQRSTSVVFHDDSTRLPRKTSRVWTVTNAQTGEVLVQATSPKLWWNFSTIGTYTVSVDVSDPLGNVSTGTKQSFVTVV
jgi:hypothetical protein